MLSYAAKGNGGLPTDILKLYINTLQQVLHSLRMRERSAYTIAEILSRKNGPRFLVHPIGDRQLKEAFNWDTEKLTSLYDLLNKAEITWIELRKEYSVMLGIH